MISGILFVFNFIQTIISFSIVATTSLFRYSINSLRKMARLRSICANLSKIENHTVTDLFELSITPDYQEKKEKEINNLIAFAKTDSAVLSIIEKYKASDTILRKLYDQLLLHGAGRYARGYWVAGSALVFPHSLEALLRYFNGENFSLPGHTDYNSGIKVAYRMFTYFTEGEKEPIEEI